MTSVACQRLIPTRDTCNTLEDIVSRSSRLTSSSGMSDPVTMTDPLLWLLHGHPAALPLYFHLPTKQATTIVQNPLLVTESGPDSVDLRRNTAGLRWMSIRWPNPVSLSMDCGLLLAVIQTMP